MRTVMASGGVFGKKEAFAPNVCETPYDPNANSWWEIQEKVWFLLFAFFWNGWRVVIALTRFLLVIFSPFCPLLSCLTLFIAILAAWPPFLIAWHRCCFFLERPLRGRSGCVGLLFVVSPGNVSRFVGANCCRVC